MALGRTGTKIKEAVLGVQDPTGFDYGDADDLTAGTTYTPVLSQLRGNIEYTNDLGVKMVFVHRDP